MTTKSSDTKNIIYEAIKKFWHVKHMIAKKLSEEQREQERQRMNTINTNWIPHDFVIK